MKNKSQRHKETNTFKFVPFAERITNINIDVFHRVGHEYESLEEENTSLFYQAVIKWDVLNLTEPYNEFRRELRINEFITLPQVLHKQEHIAEILLKHLRYKNVLCLQALLDLVVAFANDLRKDFYTFYPDAFKEIPALNFYGRSNVESNIQHAVEKYIGDVDAPKRSCTRNVYYAEESDNDENDPFHNNDDDRDGCYIPEGVVGCGKLLFEVIYGVSGQFHSCASMVLPVLLQSLENKDFPRTVLYEILQEVVSNICTRIEPQKNVLFWNTCVDNIDRILSTPMSEDATKNIEWNLQFLGQALEYKNGKLCTNAVVLVNLLLKLLSRDDCVQSTLLIVSQLCVLLSLSRNIHLPQEQASGLVRKVLTTSKILLHFVDHAKGHSGFDALILPSFLNHCIVNNMNSDCLLVLVNVILYKSPLCNSGLNWMSWKKYFVDLKTCNSNIERLVIVETCDDLIKSYENYMCGIVCLPHINLVSNTCYETISNNIKLLCKGINENSTDCCQLLFLLLATVECAAHLSNGNHLDDLFDLIIDTTLPLCTKPEFLPSLKTLDLWVTVFKDRLSMDTLDKLHNTLQSNINSPYHELRLYTLHIYTLFEHLFNVDTETQWKVFQICFNVESIDPQVYTYRNQLQNLELINFGKPQMILCKNTKFSIVPLRYLCGVLYMNFQLLWDPTIKLITSHADGLDIADFWEVFLSQLQIVAPIKNLEQDNLNNFKSSCDFLQNMHTDVFQLATKPDFVNYRILLWKALATFPQIAERKTKDVSELFLSFITEEYSKNHGEMALTWNIKQNDNLEGLDDIMQDDGEDEVKKPPKKARKESVRGGHRLKILLNMLAVFSKAQNPKAMYRESELYKLYFEFLSHKHHDVQKLALDCILTYKDKSLTPYRQHLYNLISERNFKEELAMFRIDSDGSTVQQEHRSSLIPIVLNIVYSKMFSKTGLRTGGKSSGQLRRNLVLRFVAGCEKEEMYEFMRMTFRFYAKYLSDDVFSMCDRIAKSVVLECVVPPKRLQSTLNLLSIVFEHFGGIGGNTFLNYLLKILFLIGSFLRGIFDQQENVHKGYLSTLKNLRASCFKILNRFFVHFQLYEWQSQEINCLFDMFVWPYLTKLSLESMQNPTSLLKLLAQWGALPRYFSLLVKHKHGDESRNVLQTVTELLVNKQTELSVRNLILEMFVNLLRLDYSEEELKFKIPIDDVLPIRDDILAKLSAHNLNYGSCIVLPHVPALLEILKRKLQDRSKGLTQKEIFILSRISELISEPEMSDEVLTLVLPLILKKCTEEEELVVKYVTSVYNLLQNVSSPQQHLKLLSPLFANVSYLACRKILCRSLSIVAKNCEDEEVVTLVNLIVNLNAWDTKWIDQPNFEERLKAFKKVQTLISEERLTLTLGVFVIHNCWYTLLNENDLSLKENAAHCWRNVGVFLIKRYKSPNDLNYILNDVLFEMIHKGLQCKDNDDLRNECILLLGHLSRECSNAHVVFRDFNKVCNKADVEVDFFENIIHLQRHRHERALLKLCQVFKPSECVPNPRTLTQFMLPITSIYLCNEKYTENYKLVNASIKVLNMACSLLPWHQYERILKLYLNKLQSNTDYQRELVKILVAILDAFHFNLDKANVVLQAGQENEHNATETKIDETEDVSYKNGELGDHNNFEVLANNELNNTHEGDDEKRNIYSHFKTLSRCMATKIITAIQTGLLPQLHKALAERTQHDKLHKVNRKRLSLEKEEEDLSRIPLSLALIKLLQQLPKEVLDGNVPRVFMKLCTFLKSHTETVRQVARETLQKIMQNLGPLYLPTLLNEMTSMLLRGYQVHVLVYTVHSVLLCLKDSYQPTHMDKVLITVTGICTNELFGNLAEEKEIVQIGKKVSEAKSIRSFDIFHILAQYITDKCFVDIMIPLKSVLTSSHSFKAINKVRECLRNISLGLSENSFTSIESLLKFCYGTSSESIPELLPTVEKKIVEKKEKQLLVEPKEDCFIIPQVSIRRGPMWDAKKSNNTNAHVLVEFGLNLLHHMLSKEMCKGDEFKPFLDPFVSVFKNCLCSRHVKLSTLTLQCLNKILLYDLPSLRENISEIANILFDILHKYAAAGLGKGDNFDLVSAAFKTMSTIVRDIKYYTITREQLKILLLYVEQDLYDCDRQAIAFTLLKAIILRKLSAREIHDVMRKVAELSVTSELSNVRTQGRAVFHQFIMNYPLKNKIEGHVAFFVSQISYELQSGRESAIEMIHTFINTFPIAVLIKFSESFLVTLCTQLINEEISESKKMIASCLKDMFSRLTKPDRDQLFDILVTWLEAKNITHRQLAAQVCGLLVAVEKSSFETRLTALIPIIFQQFESNEEGRYVKIKIAIDFESTCSKPEDHHLFQVYQMLLKICGYCPAFLKRTEDIQTFAEYSQTLLGHPHDWVRLAAAQFLGFVLSSIDVEKFSSLLLEKKTEELGYLYNSPFPALKSLTLDLCAQLHPEVVKTELADQIIKNLLFIARVLEKVPIENDKEVNLLWLTKRMRRVVHVEVVKCPSSYVLRSAVFKWIAAVTTVLQSEAILSVLHHLVAPLVRELRAAEEGDISTRQLAKEVGDLIKSRIGIETYTNTLAKIEQGVERKRSERKRERTQLAVTDPEMFAKKKIRLNEKKKELRKRKIAARGGKVVKKKRRKIE
ncbi:hypothetical protein FQA39_LY16615 [Lamprigera yunnana]|nr:hypothetical protein FQA39_LY16615 [Lamprigera yunnana]